MISVEARPVPSFPWCFGFLGVFLAAKFLGLFGCFLPISRGTGCRFARNRPKIDSGIFWPIFVTFELIEN